MRCYSLSIPKQQYSEDYWGIIKTVTIPVVPVSDIMIRLDKMKESAQSDLLGNPLVSAFEIKRLIEELRIIASKRKKTEVNGYHAVVFVSKKLVYCVPILI